MCFNILVTRLSGSKPNKTYVTTEANTFSWGLHMYETTFKKIPIGYVWLKAAVNNLEATKFKKSTNYMIFGHHITYFRCRYTEFNGIKDHE